MAADRFFPLYFSVEISLFNTAFYNTLFVFDTIHTNFTVDGWCNPSKFLIINVTALPFNFFFAFFIQVRKYCIKYFVYLLQFCLFQRRTCVTINTTSAFAFTKVAYKLFLYNLVAY